MPFKIIQTIEKGNIVLTCVPHQWESNGVLFWPKKQTQSHMNKLQKDENSQPDDTWKKINCAVKRRNIKTYQEAINEIDLMSNNSETETDIEEVSAKKRRKCSDVPQLSYNIMAEESLQNNKHHASSAATSEDGQQANYEISLEELPPSETLSSASQENIHKYVVLSQGNQLETPLVCSYINKEINLPEEQCDLKSIKIDINTIKSDLQSINVDMKTIMDTLNTTQNNQAVIHETLKSLLLQVTELQVMNEEFIKKSITEKQNQSLAFKKIKDLVDLEEFENKLLDADYAEELQRKLSVLCTKGTGTGTTSAYAIIDIMFERQFFKSCSWTGASRSQNEFEKICFKGFSKTIAFFFDFIHKLDSTFHLDDCHKFFKTILRNADQRCKKEPKRASTKKCRVKKSVKNTSQNLVPNETPPKQLILHEETSGSQKVVEDVTEEIFV